MTSPSAPTFPFSMFDPVHLGIDENGEHVYVNLAERNMLLGGEPGAGKSSGINGPQRPPEALPGALESRNGRIRQVLRHPGPGRQLPVRTDPGHSAR